MFRVSDWGKEESDADVRRLEELKTLDPTTEQSIPTTSSPRGRSGMYGSVLSGRAPDPKGPLDLGHQRNVGFVSQTLQKVTKTNAIAQIPISIRHLQIEGE